MGKPKSGTQRGVTSASSSRALESLQGWTPTNIGFGTFAGTNSVATAENASLPPDVQVIIKKLLKKDPVTKLKALSELDNVFDAEVLPHVDSFLESWVVLYPKLSQDVSRQVRENTGQFYLLLLSKINKKILAPHLKSLMPSWLCAICDPAKETRTVSLKAFHDTFQPAKRAEAIIFCKTEIVNNAIEILSNASKKKDADPEELENQERILSTILASISFILSLVSESEAEKILPDFEPIFDMPSFWATSKSPFPTFRKSFFELISILCQQVPSYCKDKMKEISNIAFVCLHETHPANIPTAFDTFIAFFSAFPDAWKGVDINKKILPPINQHLNTAFSGLSNASYLSLLPLLSSFPKTFMEDFQWQEKFLNSFLKGIESEVASKEILQSYFECLLFCVISLSATHESAADILLRYSQPILEVYVFGGTLHHQATLLAAISVFLNRVFGSEKYPEISLAFQSRVGAFLKRVASMSQNEIEESAQSCLIKAHEKTVQNILLTNTNTRIINLLASLSGAKDMPDIYAVVTLIGNKSYQSFIKREANSSGEHLNSLISKFGIRVLSTPEDFMDTILLPWLSGWISTETEASDWTIFADTFSAYVSHILSKNTASGTANATILEEWAKLLEKVITPQPNCKLLMILLEKLFSLGIPASALRCDLLDRHVISCADRETWATQTIPEKDIIAIILFANTGISSQDTSIIHPEALEPYLSKITQLINYSIDTPSIPIDSIIELIVSQLNVLLKNSALATTLIKFVLSVAEYAIEHSLHFFKDISQTSSQRNTSISPVTDEIQQRMNILFSNAVKKIQETDEGIYTNTLGHWEDMIKEHLYNTNKKYSASYAAFQIMAWGADWQNTVKRIALQREQWTKITKISTDQGNEESFESAKRVVNTLVSSIQTLSLQQFRQFIDGEWFYPECIVVSSLFESVVAAGHHAHKEIGSVEELSSRLGEFVRNTLIPSSFYEEGMMNPESGLSWAIFHNLWSRCDNADNASKHIRSAFDCFVTTSLDKGFWLCPQLERICKDYIRTISLKDIPQYRVRLTVLFTLMNQYHLQKPPSHETVKTDFIGHYTRDVLKSKEIRIIISWTEIISSFFKAMDEFKEADVRTINSLVHLISQSQSFKLLTKENEFLVEISILITTVSQNIDPSSNIALDADVCNTILDTIWKEIGQREKDFTMIMSGCRLYSSLNKLNVVKRDYSQDFMNQLLKYAVIDPLEYTQVEDVTNKLCYLVRQSKSKYRESELIKNIYPLIQSPHFNTQKSAAVLLKSFSEDTTERVPLELIELLQKIEKLKDSDDLGLLFSLAISTLIYYNILKTESVGFGVISDETPFHKTLIFITHHMLNNEEEYEKIWPFAWDFQLEDLEDDELSFNRLCAHLFCISLELFPSSVRSYISSNFDRVRIAKIEGIATQYISPRIISSSLANVSTTNFSEGENPMEVIVSKKSREITATITIEEFCIGVSVTIPPTFPFKPAEVDVVRRIGVDESKMRRWLLSMYMLINCKDGNICEALTNWKKAVENTLSDVENCIICYSIIHSVDKSLPRTQCKTCKNKFHGACLYRWFNTSNKSTCPLCQQAFQL